MKVATALATVLLLVPAAPAHAAGTVRASPGTVVVGDRGAGTWTTISATGVPAWVELIDADLHGPGGQHQLLDLTVINRPGVWEGQVSFSRFDPAGKWKAKLTFFGAGRRAAGPTASFSVKRRTTLSADGDNARGTALKGVLRKLGAGGEFTAYAGQKVRLYRWTDGVWAYVATDVTDRRGRYSFTGRSGRFEVRFAGTSVNASATRTVR